MSRFRAVGSVVAGLLVFGLTTASMGAVIALAVVGVPFLLPVLFFPSENFPFVWCFIQYLPGMLLGSVVATKIWWRAKEFILTVAVVAVLAVVSTALDGGLTLRTASLYLAQLVCAAICLTIDQRPAGGKS